MQKKVNTKKQLIKCNTAYTFLMLLRYGHSLLRYGQDRILIKLLRYGHF